MNTLSKVQVIKINQQAFEDCIKIAESKNPDMMRKTLLEITYQTSLKLQQAFEQIERKIAYHIRDLQAAGKCIDARAVMGNSCGIIQNIHDLDILNGETEALVPVLHKAAKALGYIQE